jgi:hypothetical protein
LKLGVCVQAVEQAVAPQVLVNALYDSLQHLADLARLEMTECLPSELCILLGGSSASLKMCVG